ncbi:MAG: ubiquinone/menaquinone biosynthesis methyltransferase, partial [Myxococcota bacterium]
TADVALAIAEAYPRARVSGLDPSVRMLDIGRDKVDADALQSRVELIEGDAQALPFKDDHFDASVISFGIRNVPDRALGLKEMARVTRPKGRVVVLELSEPPAGVMGSLARFHVHHVVPRLGALLSGAHEYRYLQDSIEAFPPADQFVLTMEAAGLENVRVKKLAFGAAHLFVGDVA